MPYIFNPWTGNFGLIRSNETLNIPDIPADQHHMNKIIQKQVNKSYANHGEDIHRTQIVQDQEPMQKTRSKYEPYINPEAIKRIFHSPQIGEPPINPQPPPIHQPQPPPSHQPQPPPIHQPQPPPIHHPQPPPIHEPQPPLFHHSSSEQPLPQVIVVPRKPPPTSIIPPSHPSSAPPGPFVMMSRGMYYPQHHKNIVYPPPFPYHPPSPLFSHPMFFQIPPYSPMMML
jgi:hypothetical protein